jgi:Zn-dependent hydrolases, including glyoxylases
VLLTHLHVDHVGWNTHLQDGQWVPVFPNATYIFSRKEYDFFATDAGAPRRMVCDDSVQPLVDAGQARMIGAQGGEEIEGIRFLPTPGHSIDHMAIEIESQGETALFSGDVMHSPVQVYRPQWNSMFCLDGARARQSRQWLLERAKGRDAFSCAFPGDQRRARAQGGGRVRMGICTRGRPGWRQTAGFAGGLVAAYVRYGPGQAKPVLATFTAHARETVWKAGWQHYPHSKRRAY